MDAARQRRPDVGALRSARKTGAVASQWEATAQSAAIRQPNVVGDTGFEPVTSAMSRLRSNQLS